MNDTRFSIQKALQYTTYIFYVSVQYLQLQVAQDNIFHQHNSGSWVVCINLKMATLLLGGSDNQGSTVIHKLCKLNYVLIYQSASGEGEGMEYYRVLMSP